MFSFFLKSVLFLWFEFKIEKDLIYTKLDKNVQKSKNIYIKQPINSKNGKEVQ